jgi:hypothetical protein
MNLVRSRALELLPRDATHVAKFLDATVTGSVRNILTLWKYGNICHMKAAKRETNHVVALCALLPSLSLVASMSIWAWGSPGQRPFVSSTLAAITALHNAEQAFCGLGIDNSRADGLRALRIRVVHQIKGCTPFN